MTLSPSADLLDALAPPLLLNDGIESIFATSTIVSCSIGRSHFLDRFSLCTTSALRALLMTVSTELQKTNHGEGGSGFLGTNGRGSADGLRPSHQVAISPSQCSGLTCFLAAIWASL